MSFSTAVSNDELGQILSSLTNKYEHYLDELSSLAESHLEDKLARQKELYQGIILDLAQDRNILARYRLGQNTKYNTYYLKHIDAAIEYLRDLRQILALYFTVEKI